MKKSMKYDTLAYQLGVRPGVVRRNMGPVLVSQIVAPLNKYLGGSKGEHLPLQPPSNPVSHPELDALRFYLANHAVSLVRQQFEPYEPLGDKLEVLEAYHHTLANLAPRMFYYLLLICTRESRHVRDAENSPKIKKLRDQYGDVILDFHSSLRGESSMSAARKLQHYPPHAPIDQYARFLRDVFYSGKFSKGYGGPAWGRVADVLCDYVTGHISAEMMLDNAFTLCHNNGPIFNKGMLFNNYTSEIYRILDVQRSGQIPQLIDSGGAVWIANPDLSALWSMCKRHFGSKVEGYVDWFKVEELGALQSYGKEKEAQVEKYGPPPNHKESAATLIAKKELEKAKADKQVKISPTITINKAERHELL